MSDYTRFDPVFFERTRLSILTIVYQRGSVSCNGLKSALDLSDGGLFSHVGKLVSAGYLDKRKELAGEAVQTVYSVSATGKAVYDEYVGFLSTVIEQHKEGGTIKRSP